MQITAVLLNITGLLLDIIGVVGLYFAITKGLGRIKAPELSLEPVFAGGNSIENFLMKKIKELHENINTVIEDTNKVNKILHQKSLIWLGFIVVGFILQAVSSLLYLGNSSALCVL